MHGFCAVGRDVEFCAGFGNVFPHFESVVGGHVDFIGEFTGEGNAHDPGVDAGGECRVAVFHEPESLFRHIEVRGHFAHDVAGFRADNGDCAVLLGRRGEHHVQFRPFRLRPVFEPFEDIGGSAGRGCHEEVVVCQTQGHTVVEHHAVGSAHDPVAGFADLELEIAVGVDPVDELRGILALDFDFAECCGIQEAHGFAHGPAFAGNCCVHVLPILRVVPRALPLADVFEHRTAGHVPRVDVRLTGGVVEFADAAPGKCRKRHRGVGGSEGCCADLPGGDSSVFSRGAAHHSVDRLLTGLAGCQSADFSTRESFRDEANGVDSADLPLVHTRGD